MKKTFKRIIALLLAVTLVLGVAPFSAFAYEHGEVVEEDETGIAAVEPMSGYAPGTVVEETEEEQTVQPQPPVEEQEAFQSENETEVPSEPAEGDKEFWELLETPGAEIEVLPDGTMKKASPRRVAAKAASQRVANGTLKIGYYAFGSNIGSVPSIGHTISQLPTKTLVSGGVHTAAYCIEVEKLATGGYNGYSPDSGNVSLESVYGHNKAVLIGDILANGYQYKGVNIIPQNDSYKWAATQIMIWQAIAGSVTYTDEKGTEFKQVCLDDVAACAKASGHYNEYYAYYYDLKNKLIAMRKIPSFAYRRPIDAVKEKNSKILPAKGDGSFGTTLTDKNKVLEYFDFKFSGGAVTTSKSGNKLTVTSTEEISSPLTSEKATHEVMGGTDSVAGWLPADSSQQIFVCADPAKDPVVAYFAVRTGEGPSGGDNTLEKECEDGRVSGITFSFVGGDEEHTTYSFSTDSNGMIALSGFKLYEKKEKLDDDGNPTGELVDDTEKPITYTVSESTPIRYVPNTQTYQFTPASGSASFHYDNINKKWNLTFTKRDSETGYAQGDATLSGAIYGLYKNGSMVDTYFTDSSGSFTTDWYYCGDGGDNWTLEEISPSTGYLLNSIPLSVGVSPGTTFVEYNPTSATGTEQVIKGKIRLTKHTDKGETGIETPEEGATFKVYLSSAGSYANARPAERDEIIIDKDGLAVTKSLPYGTYTVHQTKCGDKYPGRELIDDFQVPVMENGEIYSFILNNRVFEALITVMKKDIETGRLIPASGITFKIRDCKTGDYIVQHINYPTPMDISLFQTDVTGKLMLPEKLNYGDYELVEFATAYGYVLDTTPVPFKVDGTAKEVVVEKSNIPQKGVIRLYKEGEVYASVDKRGENGPYVPVYAKQGLPGAVFHIFAAEDIRTPEGTIRYTMGQQVGTMTTDSEGRAESTPLYLGKYMVKEVKAPEGYVLDTTPRAVTLSYSNQEEELSFTDITIGNTRQKVSIDLHKAMEKDKDFNLGENGEYENVAFGLFSNGNLTAADGSFIPEGGLIEQIGVDENGNGKFTADLPFGSFYVQEIATDDHYLLNDEKWPVTFTYIGQEKAISYFHLNDGANIQNTLKRGVIDGSKSDEDGLLLGGALMGLFAPGETEFTEDTAIRTAVSQPNGDFTFEDVPFGPWLVREIAPPEAFVLNEKVFSVNVREDGEHVNVEVENRFIRGDVKLYKVDAEYTGKKLSGAAFDVYSDSNGNRVFDEGDVKEGSLKETAPGVYEMDGLRYGGYFVVETKAPAYYVLDETPHWVDIHTDGQLVELKVANEPEVGNLHIQKASEDLQVEGIKFTVFGKPYTGGSYEEEFVTDENGEILITGLRVGEYTVSEVLDNVTVRYMLEDDKTAAVTAGETAYVDFFNKLRRGEVYVIKTDPDYPESKLTGAKFKVWRDANENQKYDDSDPVVGVLQEDDGVYWLEGLPRGGFFLREEIAPENYLADNEYHYFEVTDDTAQVEVTNTPDPNAGFVNRKLTGSLTITKKSTSGALLAGANFALKTKDGEAVSEGTTGKDGKLVFEDLPCGEELIWQEICAPTGYETDSTEHTVKITADKLDVEVTAINEQTPFFVPKTGDGRVNPAFCWALLAVCAAGAAGIVSWLVCSKKKKGRR